jgi:tetratricopeptide (TPR) repeat protein
LASRVGYCWDDPAKLSLLDSDNQTIQAVAKWCIENQNHASALQIIHDTYYYYLIRGLWENLIQITQLGVDAASQLNDPSVEIYAIAKYIQMICRAGQVPENVGFTSRMSHLVDTLSLEPEVLFEYHFAIFQYWMAHQNLAAAENVFRSALTYTETNSLHNHVVAQQWLGICLYRQGRWLEAQQFLQAALQVSVEISSELDIVFCRIFLAAIETDQGGVNTATELLEGSIDIAHVYQDRESIALIYHIYARLHSLRGELPEAHASLTEAIDLFERMGMRRELAEAREELARLEAQMAASAE